MLRSKNIYLRALEPEDVKLLVEWENNTEVWSVSGTLAPFSKSILSRFVENGGSIADGGQYRFMISLNEDDVTIGCVDLFEYDPVNRRVGIGILIADKRYRAKGLAKEALNISLDYCTEQLKLHQVFCSILEDNVPSIHLFEAFGFEKYGVRKDWIMKSPTEWTQELMYQKILD